MKYVPDTSVIINGKFFELISSGGHEVIIPEAVVSEIEAQANRGLMIGFTGLKEMEKIRALEREGKINLRFYGKRPEKWQIEKAKSGEIDEMIRLTAIENNAILVTSDFVQSSIARIKGIEVIYIETKKGPSIKIEDFFDKETMSVHLKVNTVPMAKKGSPGRFNLVKLSDNIMDEMDLEDIAMDIVERARSDTNSYIEMEMKGVTVVQLREYRIVITREPFSDGIEITAVKPIVKFSIEHYSIDDRLLKRLKESTRGIIISGAPGAGKTTFAQALAEMYSSEGKIVKTLERPRDLQVKDEITQYTALEGSMEKAGNILLLVRPDYTIFDEVRSSEDFQVYADLRLSGVGMVGVVHATRPVDAIQRLIGRIELGMIPQVADTFIHIDSGEIKNVYYLEYTVKVPSGMREEDLSRPVIEVRDFYKNSLEYEIYSFGEQVVVVPVKGERGRIYELAEEKAQEILKRHIGSGFRLEITSPNSMNLYVPGYKIPELIGKGGENIDRLERVIGLHINVLPYTGGEKEKINLIVQKKKDYLYLIVEGEYGGREGAIIADDDVLFSGVLSRDGIIKLKQNSPQGKAVLQALGEGKKLYFKPW
ncbi:MAG: PINc/VapC family ATPase [Thermoplasmata archaeon]|jgi:ATPase|nr:ATPase [Euryarchaeota archaeon]MVT35512.1 ATPase [Euryarchaeota archaeon]